MRSRAGRASVVRPANTTAYATGQVIGTATAANNALAFQLPSESLGMGRIHGAALIDSANVATKPDIDVFLFEDVAPTLAADGAAFAPTDAEMKNCIGCISLAGSGAKAGDSTASTGNTVNNPSGVLDLAFAAPVNKAIFAVLVVRNAYVPLSGEEFTLKLYYETTDG